MSDILKDFVNKQKEEQRQEDWRRNIEAENRKQFEQQTKAKYTNKTIFKKAKIKVKDIKNVKKLLNKIRGIKQIPNATTQFKVKLPSIPTKRIKFTQPLEQNKVVLRASLVQDTKPQITRPRWLSKI